MKKFWSTYKKSRFLTVFITITACLLIGISLFLFIDPSENDSALPKDHQKIETSSTETKNTLKVPDKDAQSTDSDRSSLGKNRLQPGDKSNYEDSNSDDQTKSEASLNAPLLKSLTGVRIALSAAAAEGTNSKKKCAPAANLLQAKSQGLVIQNLATSLQKANAVVIRADQPAACINARITKIQTATLAVIIGSAINKTKIYDTALLTNNKSTPISKALASELSSRFNIKVESASLNKATIRMIKEAGAVDPSGKTAVVLLNINPAELTNARASTVSNRIILALAATAARIN